ncbi:DNA primase [bacterium]|nr:DNA primase [bacterium]MBU1753380.1 DNA primase [bacterium]
MSGQGFIPEETITHIRESVDIVELISEYVTLKKIGENYKGLCPFHAEQTPSFIVNPKKGIFHCFGCHVGGNVFSFLVKKEGIEFVDAVKLLAKRAGISVNVVAFQKSFEKENLYEIHEAAVSFYQNLLWSREGASALEYLRRRGLTDETLKRFRIGYAPPEWRRLSDFLLAKTYSIGRMLQSGLVVQKDRDSRVYDRFRERVIFPIFDEVGKPIGFGGRALNKIEGRAKYINSPETPLYNKSKVLYGLHLAKESMRTGGVIVVEGYMDVAMLSQSGFPNVVAASGTAFTHDQIRLIKRYTSKIWLIFDPDTAGIQATLRSMDLLMEHNMDMRVVSLPDGLDPADYLLKGNGSEFTSLLDQAQGFSDWRFKFAIKNDDMKTTPGKKKALEHLLAFIVRVNDPIERQDLIRRTAEVLGLNETIIINELKASTGRTSATLQTQQWVGRGNTSGNLVQGHNQIKNPALAGEYLRREDKGHREVEKSIIYFLLTNDDLEEKERVSCQLFPDEFSDPVCREVFCIFVKLFSQQRVSPSGGGSTLSKGLSPSMIIEYLEQKARDFVSSLIFQEKYKGEDIEVCLKKLKGYAMSVKLKVIQQLIAEKEKNGEMAIDLIQQYKELTGKR